MINNIVRILLCSTIAGSLLFMNICLIDMYVGKNNTMWQDLLAKITLAVFSVPIIVLLVLIFKEINPVLYMSQSDLNILKVFELENIYITNTKIYKFFLAVWLTGFFIYIYFFVCREHKVVKSVVSLSDEVKDLELLEYKAKICQKLKIKKNVKILYCSFIDSPFLTGIIEPKIIFPKNNKFEKEEVQLFLKHELVHIKRHDIFFSTMLLWIQGLHWFNPVFILFSNKFRMYSELACDNACIEEINKEIYAKLIIKTIKNSICKKNITEFAARTEKDIKRRIYHIMKKNVKKRGAMAMAILLYTLSVPVISYASAYGVLVGESEASKAFGTAKYGVEENVSSVNTYRIESEKVRDGIVSVKINIPETKGANLVDFTLPAKGSAEFNSVYMKSGSSIRINVSADNTSDKFKAGYKYGNTIKSVTSVDGVVNYTFKINSEGEYTVYFAGLNQNTDINIIGGIYFN